MRRAGGELVVVELLGKEALREFHRASVELGTGAHRHAYQALIRASQVELGVFAVGELAQERKGANGPRLGTFASCECFAQPHGPRALWRSLGIASTDTSNALGASGSATPARRASAINGSS
jgi:hypothetical protein